MDERIYPLSFAPVLRDYVWGGRRLEALYGRRLPPGTVAESWEVSGHPEGATEALSGHWQGRTLDHIQAALGEALLGRHGRAHAACGRFPLLVKLLDAHQDLSVQVHPDDAQAARAAPGELGKTEMWYVLHAPPDYELIHGLQPGVTPEALRRALEEGRTLQALRRLPVRPGDCVYIPAGTVHALLAGAVVAEIQQTSDVTYRLYDWDRTEPNGTARALHIDEALAVIDYAGERLRDCAPELLADEPPLRRERLVACPQFVVERLRLAAGGTYAGQCDGRTFFLWGCVEGRAELHWAGSPLALPAIAWTLLPATLGDYRLQAQSPATLLCAYLPEPQPGA